MLTAVPAGRAVFARWSSSISDGLRAPRVKDRVILVLTVAAHSRRPFQIASIASSAA
jgi:hypothetical protein